MKVSKLLIIILSLAILIGGVYYGVKFYEHKTAEKAEETGEKVIHEFGARLKNVSLLSPEEELRKNIEDNYAELITPELLSLWLQKPDSAEGRLTSSPWPDRIEIWDMAISENTISAGAQIISVSSDDPEGKEGFSTRPIDISLVKRDNRWLIDKISSVGPEKMRTHQREDYGFSFDFPSSWDGYSAIETIWEGNILGEEPGTQWGPYILFRHPQWTEESPRQDIPIMLFTIEQWDLVQTGKLSVSAAPIPPSELGRNANYVFALPARYNFSFLEGFEEVEKILKKNPLHAF